MSEETTITSPGSFSEFAKKTLQEEGVNRDFEVHGITKEEEQRLRPLWEQAEKNHQIETILRKQISEQQIKKEKGYLGFSKPQQKTALKIKDKSLFYEHTPINFDNGISFEKQYSTYKIEPGEGQAPIFIITRTELATGHNEVCIEPVSEEQTNNTINDISEHSQKKLKDLAKAVGVAVEFGEGREKEKRPSEEIISDLKSRQQSTRPFLYQTKPPIDLKEVRGKDCLEIVKTVLDAEMGFDPDLLTLYAAYVVKTTEDAIPERIMPYNAHSIVVTNSATGKSTAGRRISQEPPSEQTTAANILGFANADGGTAGKLHGRHKTLFIDEFQENSRDNVGGALLGFLESGNQKIDKGAGGQLCKGTAAIVFQGNPPIKNIEGNNSTLQKTLLVNEFLDALEKIKEDNPRAIGKRIAVTVFGQEYKTVQSSPLTNEEATHGDAILETIAEATAQRFSKSIENNPEVRKWLDQPHEKEYLEALQELGEQAHNITLKEYLKGQEINNKHLRGTAFRLAILEQGLQKTTLQEIIESAESHLLTLQRINLDSFNRLVEIIPEVAQKLTDKAIDSIKAEYVRIALYAFFEARNNGHTETIVPLSLIGTFHKEAIKQIENPSKKYAGGWSRVESKFEEIRESTINKDLERLGVKYSKRQKSFLVLRKSDVEATMKQYQDMKGTIGTTGTTGTTGTIGTEEKEKKPGSLKTTVPIVPCTRQVLSKDAHVEVEFLQDQDPFVIDKNTTFPGAKWGDSMKLPEKVVEALERKKAVRRVTLG